MAKQRREMPIWKRDQEREAKKRRELKRMQAERAAEEIKKCTFRPQLSGHSLRLAAKSRSRTGPGGRQDQDPAAALDDSVTSLDQVTTSVGGFTNHAGASGRRGAPRVPSAALTATASSASKRKASIPGQQYHPPPLGEQGTIG